jgi:site-specific recombinase XerD
MSNSTMLPFQPGSMTPAQLAAVSYPVRYAGHTHSVYACGLRRGFQWCETDGLDPLIGIQRAHVELYIRHLGGCGPMPSSNKTMLHGGRGFLRFSHIDGLIHADPAVYARLPKIHPDQTRAQGLDRRTAAQLPATRPEHQRAPRRPSLPARRRRPARPRSRRTRLTTNRWSIPTRCNPDPWRGS